MRLQWVGINEEKSKKEEIHEAIWLKHVISNSAVMETKSMANRNKMALPSAWKEHANNFITKL